MTQPTAYGPKTAQEILDSHRSRKQRGSNLSTLADVPRTAILFRNDSNETVPAYGCMRVIGAEVDPVTDRYVVVIAKPNGDGAPFIFNGPREVATTAYGQGYSEIVRAAYVSGNTPAFGQYWGPKASWEIEQTGRPAVLVYGDLENGFLFGMSLKGQSVTIKVVPDNDVSPGNSVACTIWEGRPPLPTTQVINEVWLDWEAGGEQVSAGKQARAVFEPLDGVWRFVSAECEGDAEPGSKVTSSTDSSVPASDSTAAIHVNNDGVYLNDGAGAFNAVTAPPA